MGLIDDSFMECFALVLAACLTTNGGRESEYYDIAAVAEMTKKNTSG